MKKALIFGAGNIGRGFLGLELYKSGYSITFTDVDEKVLNAIKTKAGYEVEIIESGNKEFIPVENAFHSNEDLTTIIHDASLIVMAVGPKNLKHIAKKLAPSLGTYHRRDYKNVIACENMVNGSSELKRLVLEEGGQISNFISFPDAVVDRISLLGEDSVRVESFFEWVVDKKGWQGELDVKCIKYVDNLEAYLKRKLYLLNGSHVTIGTMGQLYGIKYVHEAMQDPRILKQVLGQMQEVNAVLMDNFGFKEGEQADYIQAILSRFRNEKIRDETRRLARDPIRKLGREERLLGPALLSKNPDHLAKAIAYLMLWENSEDKESVELAKSIGQKGIAAALKEYANIGGYEEQDLIGKVEKYFVELMDLKE